MNRKGYYIDDQYALYFITLTVVGWVDIFTRKEYKEILVEQMNYYTENAGWIIYAYVIMSNHMHFICKAASSSSGLSAIIRDFKKMTAKRCLAMSKNSIESRSDWMNLVFNYHAKYNARNRRQQFWQQNNRPIVLISPKFIFQKLDYIHYNPVSANIVLNPEDYLYSSAQIYADLPVIIPVKLEVLDLGCTDNYIYVG